MTQVVVLLGSYYPNYSAVGYCVHQVLVHLKDEFEVTVVASGLGASENPVSNIDGLNVVYVDTLRIRWLNFFGDRPGWIARVARAFLRIGGVLHRLFSPATIDGALVKAYSSALAELDVRPDVIIPAIFPFESALGALKHRESNRDAILIPYIFDDFADSGSLHVLGIARELKRRGHIRLERELLMQATAVISMHQLQDHFERNFSRDLVNKIQFREHPLLVAPKTTLEEKSECTIRLCYTGSLIRNVREPTYLLDLLSALRICVAGRADFYVLGNAGADVKTGHTFGGLQIVNHGRVAKLEADAAVMRADILLNIGERTGRQVSSKVFEYMATGKPIVHIAFVKNDVVAKLLSKYPLALSMFAESDSFEENMKLFEQFINRHHSSRISFDEVSRIFPEACPQESANAFSTLIHENKVS